MSAFITVSRKVVSPGRAVIVIEPDPDGLGLVSIRSVTTDAGTCDLVIDAKTARCLASALIATADEADVIDKEM